MARTTICGTSGAGQRATTIGAEKYLRVITTNAIFAQSCGSGCGQSLAAEKLTPCRKAPPRPTPSRASPAEVMSIQSGGSFWQASPSQTPQASQDKRPPPAPHPNDDIVGQLVAAHGTPSMAKQVETAAPARSLPAAMWDFPQFGAGSPPENAQASSPSAALPRMTRAGVSWALTCAEEEPYRQSRNMASLFSICRIRDAANAEAMML